MSIQFHFIKINFMNVHHYFNFCFSLATILICILSVITDLKNYIRMHVWPSVVINLILQIFDICLQSNHLLAIFAFWFEHNAKNNSSPEKINTKVMQKLVKCANERRNKQCMKIIIIIIFIIRFMLCTLIFRVDFVDVK